MRRYLIRLFLFLLPLLLLIVIMEILLRRIPNDYSFKREQTLTKGATFKFIILGSSHAYRGVDPGLTPVAGFNLANISQDIHLDWLVLSEYIEHMPHLEDILLCMSYGHLRMAITQGTESWRIKNYSIYMDIPVPFTDLKHHTEMLNRPVKNQLSMLWDHCLTASDNRECNPHGAASYDLLSGPERLDNGLEAALRHTKDKEEFQRNVYYLDSIIALAAKRSIRVHLFIPPGWSTYTDHLDPGQLHELRSVCLDRAAAYAHVHYDDLLFDDRFVSDDFHDADHLSLQGQFKLTNILYQQIRQRQGLQADDRERPH